MHKCSKCYFDYTLPSGRTLYSLSVKQRRVEIRRAITESGRCFNHGTLLILRRLLALKNRNKDSPPAYVSKIDSDIEYVRTLRKRNKNKL
jgi:hypothetical protein